VWSVHGWDERGDSSGPIGQPPSEPKPVPSLATEAPDSDSDSESESAESVAPESGSGFSLASVEPVGLAALKTFIIEELSEHELAVERAEDRCDRCREALYTT
jgi:hypothetical protein